MLFCPNDECANYLPCHEHEVSFEVESCNTIYSGFTSLTFECESVKHHDDTWFGSCTHFRQYQPSQAASIFISSIIHLSKEPVFWFDGMKCNICFKEIEDPDELVLNLTDMCQFHYDCIQRMLQTRGFIKCPGCDTKRCRACYHCSY